MNNPPDSPIRVVILDSHVMVRAGLRLIVDSHPDFKVVGESGEANEALEIVASQKPDIILLKLDSAGSLDLNIIPELSKTSNLSRIILLTRVGESQELLVRAIQQGVLGIVLKTQPPEVLIKAIQKVHAGEVWIEHSMIAKLLTSLNQARPPVAQDPDTENIARLSVRELQVIQLIGKGLKNQQIADQLCLSETTVRHYLTTIYNKLGVSDRLELLVFAHRFGLDK